jgi:hypothetical protein
LSRKIVLSESDIDLFWLQAVLDRKLAREVQLSGFSVRSSPSTNAFTALIHFQYTGDTNRLPRSLFLKSCRGESGFVADSEYLYYTCDYVGLLNSPLPLCYDAQYSKETGDYHLLLEDLSKSHYSNKDVKPTLEHALSVAVELARLHAYCYSWEECQEDYRLCLAHGIYTAIGWGTDPDMKSMKWLWAKQLQRSIAAFSDWQCEEMLG